MVDCCSAPGLIPYEKALKSLLEGVPLPTRSTKQATKNADKAVLAEDVYSSLNVPAHNNSAMDGYAINDQNLITGRPGLNSFELVGTALAGAPFAGELKHGQCIRIMTGAVVPDSSTAVIMQENVESIKTEIGDQVILTSPAKFRSNIRLAGEDLRLGELVFKAGHQLNATDLGLLASIGISEVSIYEQLSVAIFATGDELKAPGDILQTGDIYESNSHVVSTMLKRLGYKVTDFGIIEDDYDTIKKAFLDASELADAVISSGGVSVGDADYTKAVLDELGTIDFWKVAIKPGKPFAFGTLPNSIFFGLPGNPVSAAVTFHKLALPALQKMAGSNHISPNVISATTTHSIKKKPGRRDYQRGVWKVNADGQIQVTPLQAQGSGILSSLSHANCYIVLSETSGRIETGEKVTIELFDAVMGRHI